ncbi:MAG: hypothetical protein J6A61_05775 [Clostridia bacterium]|nr:hypothetical protein [Clostridia bacterium]
MREVIKDYLRSDKELMELLGGQTDKFRRVYSVVSNMEEFPRLIVVELYSFPEGGADNEAILENGAYRITLYSKNKNYSEILKRIRKVLGNRFPDSVISVDSDGYEKDTKVYSKSLKIEIMM